MQAPLPWRMLHGDPRHTHRANALGPRRAKLAWTSTIGAPIEAQVVPAPDERTLYVAALDGSLTALDAATGIKTWSVPLGDRVYATPCVSPSGTIYVGSDAKRFFALTPKGTVAWKLEVSGEADTGAVPFGDLVVFAAGASVFAVRPGGDVAWRFDAKKKVFTAPARRPRPGRGRLRLARSSRLRVLPRGRARVERRPRHRRRRRPRDRRRRGSPRRNRRR